MRDKYGYTWWEMGLWIVACISVLVAIVGAAIRLAS